MKKFLSLVLVLVMALSVVTISAGAATFSDSATIKYPEAAELLHGLEIHKGFEDQTYQPQNLMSRGFACKVVVECMIGVEKGLKLPITKSTFKDVAMDYRYAPYVNYLAEQGIVGGYGDGTFQPKEVISVDGMLKLALGALGYKGNYAGENWQWNVRTAAKAAGILNGIDGFAADTANREEIEWYAIRRDEGAQVMMNTLLGTVVTYTGDKAVASPNSAAAHYEITAGVAGDNVMQLCEKSMPTLKKDAKAVDFLDREGTSWTKDDATVCFILN